MKRHLLLISLFYLTIASNGQNSIPNGNFEQWSTGTCNNPQNYPVTSNSENFFRNSLPFNVTKVTDAYHGSFAVQLESVASAADTFFGYFLNIRPENSPDNWTGGMFYNQKPLGIRGYFKYNVATADSGTVIVAFSKAGVNIGSYFFSIGGVHNSYTLFAKTFSPALTQTPDSVAIGFLSCSLGNGEPNGPAGSILKIDSISFTGVTSQPSLLNGDFELWQTQTFNKPDNWYLEGSNGEGFNKTSDHVAGSFAIELVTTLGNQNNHPAARSGRISTGYYPDNCNGNCYQQGGFPFINQIDTLAFWYKYAPSGNDSATINLNFKLNNNNLSNQQITLHSASTYQYYELPFNLGQSPDSVIIDIQSSHWNDTLVSFVGSSLKIDEIHFKSQPLNSGISNTNNESSFSIYPNPSNGKFVLRAYNSNIENIQIYNLTGEIIFASSDMKQSLKEIDLSAYPKGIYFVKIFNGNTVQTKKITIQ